MAEIIPFLNYNSPLGELIIATYQGEVCMIDWKFRKMRKAIDQRISKALNATLEVSKPSEIHEQVVAWLDAYFKGVDMPFTLPILFVGSNFQKSVWNALLSIERGKTLTYLELASQLGNPEAVRAVATANGANALSIVVPCHRVIGSDGALTGYAGGLPAKRKLLELEGARVVSGQMSFF